MEFIKLYKGKDKRLRVFEGQPSEKVRKQHDLKYCGELEKYLAFEIMLALESKEKKGGYNYDYRKL